MEIELWTLLAVVAGIFISVFSLVRDILKEQPRAVAKASGDLLKIVVTNPGHKQIVVRRLELIGAEIGKDTADPPYGTVVVHPTGERTVEVAEAIPANSNTEFSSYWIPGAEFKYLKSRLSKERMFVRSGEYNVTVELIL